METKSSSTSRDSGVYTNARSIERLTRALSPDQALSPENRTQLLNYFDRLVGTYVPALEADAGLKAKLGVNIQELRAITRAILFKLYGGDMASVEPDLASARARSIDTLLRAELGTLYMADPHTMVPRDKVPARILSFDQRLDQAANQANDEILSQVACEQSQADLKVWEAHPYAKERIRDFIKPSCGPFYNSYRLLLRLIKLNTFDKDASKFSSFCNGLAELESSNQSVQKIAGLHTLLYTDSYGTAEQASREAFLENKMRIALSNKPDWNIVQDLMNFMSRIRLCHGDNVVSIYLEDRIKRQDAKIGATQTELDSLSGKMQGSLQVLQSTFALNLNMEDIDEATSQALILSRKRLEADLWRSSYFDEDRNGLKVLNDEIEGLEQSKQELKEECAFLERGIRESWLARNMAKFGKGPKYERRLEIQVEYKNLETQLKQKNQERVSRNQRLQNQINHMLNGALNGEIELEDETLQARMDVYREQKRLLNEVRYKHGDLVADLNKRERAWGL